MRKDSSTSLADKLFPDKEEENIEILDIPAEKRKLNTETYDFTISTIADYIKDKHIVIPKFQRGYVWNRAQASRLIESLIIQCPIPVIFLSQNLDETLAVIDGNQRLNSISLFLEDDFALRGLTAYPELEGFKFSELDPRLQRHIQNRTIRCIVILKDTHPQIKFDVFERLNTGSVKLNPQELRHGIHSGPLMELLEELAKNKLWRQITGYKNDKRMKNEELILRFFALRLNWRNYTKPLVSFLNNFSEQNRNISDSQKIELSEDFLKMVSAAHSLFDNLAFRTYDSDYKNQKFNAALFDAQTIALFEINPEESRLKKIDKTSFKKRNYDFIRQPEFLRYVSSGTTDKKSVTERIRLYKEFLLKEL